jgi:hypothetical protein
MLDEDERVLTDIEKMTLKGDREEALSLIEADREMATRVAFGLEEPVGATRASILKVLIKVAKSEGDMDMYNLLVKQQGYDGISAARELAARRGIEYDDALDEIFGTTKDGSTEKTVSALLADRIKKGGIKTQKEIDDVVSNLKKDFNISVVDMQRAITNNICKV